ncbi:hypothetical protein R5O87_19260 [Arthrobacter globiformis]|uniref:hypothetical protein n=1 Tax=Arthrobacter globiformis TaxID=1665 RepID=UPI0039786264
MSTTNHGWRRAVFAVVLAVTGCTYTTAEPAPSASSPNPFAPLEKQVQLFMDEGAVAAVVQIRWPDGEWSKAYGGRDLEHSDGCTIKSRHQARGMFWDYQTVTVSSADGRYQAAMTATTPPIPSESEDPSNQNKRELLNGQVESSLNETLDRLCAPAG